MTVIGRERICGVFPKHYSSKHSSFNVEKMNEHSDASHRHEISMLDISLRRSIDGNSLAINEIASHYLWSLHLTQF